ncbi:MAG: hydrogenase maturation nickel metallochaperone HypA [Anaerolineaceae bacterium]
MGYNRTMHELSVTENILQIANEAAQSHSAQKVTDIFITIGRLSSIVDDCIQFYWDHISQGSLSEGAVLHFNRIPARLRCKTCGVEFELKDELFPCPACQSIQLEVISGDEFQIDHIEILTEEEV